jgi:hypothetical protein
MVRKGSALILGSNGNKVIFLVTTLDHEVIGECWITSEQLENVIEQAQQVRAYGKLINE